MGTPAAPRLGWGGAAVALGARVLVRHVTDHGLWSAIESGLKIQNTLNTVIICLVVLKAHF